MLYSALGRRGAFSAPHHAATQTGLAILRDGGSAIEAMVGAAATIAVTYPHMNGIGGDGFWLIHRPGHAPIGIFAGGHAAAMANREWYAAQGVSGAIPARGPMAALTVPGSISGWAAALANDHASDPVRRHLPLSRLLGEAISYARDGISVTDNQARTTADKATDLLADTGFSDVYLPGGKAPERGALMRQSALGDTLDQLARDGLQSYYTGDIAHTHAAFLDAAGSPLRFDDFASYAARQVTPLSVETSAGRLYNMIPPTQGISSLMILALFDRLVEQWGVPEADGFAHLHGLVEATKRAFLMRNAELGDLDGMTERAAAWLTPGVLDREARAVDPARALPWPHVPRTGDTIWMGATDSDGTTVSFIQSVFWEFGSGVMCPDTGVVFQNRGSGFSLASGPNQLTPRRVPFHTLNPALAHLKDGRVMAYGTMGGEGQPQTQAAVFSRYAMFGQPLQQAITAPRWLLGRTWGDEATSLRLESRFDPDLITALRAAGHAVQTMEEFSDLAGHAGAVVTHPSGGFEAASDPRSDGAALAY